MKGQQDATASGEPGFAKGLLNGTVEIIEHVKAVSDSNQSSAILGSSTAFHKVLNLQSSSPSETIDGSLLGIGALEVYHIDSHTNFDSAIGRSSGVHLKRE